MDGCCIDIAEEIKEDDLFRKVLFTGLHNQVAVMALKPGEELGFETDLDTDLFIYIFEGSGKAFLEGKDTRIGSGMAVIIPAGVEYNLVNTSKSNAMKFYCIYSPPEYPKGCIHKTRLEALEDNYK